MLARIKSVINYPFSPLTPKEAYQAARQGDLAALKVFVEKVKLQETLIVEEYRLVNNNRRLQGKPALLDYPRKISKDYTVDSVSTNARLWYRIYKHAARNNHINIMKLLDDSLCIVIHTMDEKDLEKLLIKVFAQVSRDTLIYLFNAGAFNTSIDGFETSYSDLNDNRELCKKLLEAALRPVNPEIIAFLVEDCHVDKTYILKFLTESLSDAFKFNNSSVEFLISKMKPETIAELVAIENKLRKSKSTHYDLQTADVEITTLEDLLTTPEDLHDLAELDEFLSSRVLTNKSADTVEDKSMIMKNGHTKTFATNIFECDEVPLPAARPKTSWEMIMQTISNGEDSSKLPSASMATNDKQKSPHGEDSNISHSPSIVAKDKGEADEVAPDRRPSSSTMEPVVSTSPHSTPNNSDTTVQDNDLVTLMKSLPNHYNNSNDNTGNLKRDLEELKYQVSQIQASLATEQEITQELRNHKLLMEQLNYIANGDAIVLAYFMELKSRLTDYFIASRIISSGMVERAPKLLTDKLKKLLSDFSSLLTGIANFAAFASSEIGKTASEGLKSLGDGLHIGGFLKELLPPSLTELLTSLIESEEKCLERVAVISSGNHYTLSGLEYTADVIALILTYLYQPQTTCLTEKGAKVLARCSAERVMILGKEGLVTKSNEWISVVIALIGQPTLKQTSGFREIEIETKPEYKGRWTENGIHCKSGIMCLHKGEVIFHANGDTKHNKYGFRINGRSIAESLYKMKVLTSDQVSEDVKRTSSQYFLCNVSHSPKLLEKASCDDVQQSNEVSLIPTSFTAASDQNNSLYLVSALQEIRSYVARVQSVNSQLRDENAVLKEKLKIIQSNVTSLFSRQQEHQSKFDNLRSTGIDVDRPVEAGSVLLQTVEFSDPHGRGTFFLSQQTQAISRLGTLEQVVAELCDAQKLHSNK